MADLKFTHTHEWLKMEEDDTAVIGITQHAQALLGDMVYIEMPKVGLEVQAGDEIGVVESVKAASDFYAPISGVVVAVNESASDNPSIVNQDPYGDGWLVKIQAKNGSDLQDLLTEEEYEQEISEDK
jgi:glycine cleavage system H protein